MTKQILLLRQRMIDDMNFRNMSPNTRKVYTYAVANFSTFHGRSPDKLGIEDIRQCRLHLMARGLTPASINPIIGALRFFYGVTLGQKEIAGVLSVDWSSYPILTSSEAPRLEIDLVDRPTERPFGAGEPACTPVGAALAFEMSREFLAARRNQGARDFSRRSCEHRTYRDSAIKTGLW